MLDAERAAFDPSYPDHEKLMVFEDGRQLHPTRSPTGSTASWS